ncbi:uroporphyrinogen decarboxylase family protein [Natronincola ferrireducens]|uniref:Uroporphyrinogen decarboxylase n=1 Tax=Natronincola ferrireducens TaxID=393762 RepID=A0A1G9IXU5_9FIRM|nr:uroporphyrinogen decarboxylase family protein [Natronincola ferrireducens]SDL29664.1 uroporphyrinogen decarboxylase [Natronincola ferrireducens]
MKKMTKKERVLAALNGQSVDRVPVSIWLHYPHKDQDPKSLADIQMYFTEKYDFDFIKLMPFGLYSVQDWGCKVKIFGTHNQPPIVDEVGINCIDDWNNLEVLPGWYGTLGKQVQLAEHVNKLIQKGGEEIPFVQTIFSPLTTARKLAGDRIFEDMKAAPEVFHKALQVITDTTINFINENIKAGVSGFFFATQCATYELMTDEEYDEFGVKYDLQLFDAYKDKTYFNIVHIHGDDVMFEKLANYPANCVNWHDRWVSPSLSEARKITNKCLLGGLNEHEVLFKGNVDDIYTHVQEAVKLAGTKGFMLGPGCVADPDTPDINYYAARLAIERFGSNVVADEGYEEEVAATK